MKLDKSVVVWGAGERCKSFIESIGEDNICAIIDSDVTKQGEEVCGKRIIGFEQFLEQFGESYPIMISAVYWEKKIAEEIKRAGVEFFFRLSEEPTEFQGYGCKYPWSYLEIEKYRLIDGKIVIIGSNLYSCCVYKYLRDNSYDNVYLYTTNDRAKRWIEKNMDVLFAESIDKEKDKVLLASWEKIGEINEADNVENIMDLSLCIDVYENERLESFKNIHYGKSCLIVANGPSTKVEDLQRVYGVRTFGVNRIYNIEDKWVPDYYVCVDRTMFMDDKAYKYSAKTKFFSEMSERYDSEYERKGNINTLHCAISSFSDPDIPFSEDIAKRVYSGNTVVYVCIQVAAYMGFKEIYLYGTDCYYQKGKCNHFYGEELNDEGDHWQETSIRAYEAAKRYTDNHGIKIYNATRGGKLEVFERVDFDTLPFVNRNA